MGVYYEQVQITGDASGLERTLDSASRKVSSSATDWARRLTTAGRSLSRFGQSATRYVTLPLIGAAAAAVKLASDAEETANKVQVTFGRMAGSIFDWSKNSIRNMGFAQQTAQEMASTFGLLFHAAKLPQPEIVRLSKQFTQLAGDMVSFFNVPIDQALMDLRSGLVGETEPLRKYGVLLSEAALQQEAVRMGLIRADQELTEQQKVMARASVITNSLSKAQGDFVRTSGSVANQARSTVEQLKEMGAAFGKDLLPVAKEVLGVLQDLIEDFRGLSPEVRQNIIKWGALAIALGPIARLLGSILGSAGTLIRVLPRLGGAAATAAAAQAAAGAGAAGAGAAGAGAAAGGTLAAGVAGGLMVAGPLVALAGIVDAQIQAAKTEAAIQTMTAAMRDGKHTARDYASEIDRIFEERDLPEWAKATFLDSIAEASERAALQRRVMIEAALAGAGAEQGFAEALAGSTKLTDKQATKVAGLIGKLGRYGVELDSINASSLKSFIATGQVDLAMQLLQKEIDKATEAHERYGRRQARGIVQDRLRTDSVAKFGEAADHAARNVKGLGDVIRDVPDELHIDLVMDIIRTRLRTEGAVKGGALGGIVRAAAGGIAQMPIYQFGEGAYHTPFGRGAEGIIPFDSRGIRVLSEALGMAMSKMGGSSAPMNYDRLARALADALGAHEHPIRIGDFEVARALDRRRTRLGQR